MNAELWGRPCPDSFSAAVRYPQELLLWGDARISELKNVAALARVSIGDAAGIIESIQSGNRAAALALAPFLTPRYPSQILAALLEGAFVFLILVFLWRRARKPGFIGASFLLCYAVARFIDEFYRSPDAHIGLQLFELSRGQWLSIPVFCFGILLLIYSRRQKASALFGGWASH